MSPLTVNEYFEGKVKSIAFQGRPYRCTVGVMSPGEYEFSTGKAEIMTVISGQLEVKFLGKTTWENFPAGTKFNVDSNSKFQLNVKQDTAYLCEFVD